MIVKVLGFLIILILSVKYVIFYISAISFINGGKFGKLTTRVPRIGKQWQVGPMKKSFKIACIIIVTILFFLIAYCLYSLAYFLWWLLHL